VSSLLAHKADGKLKQVSPLRQELVRTSAHIGVIATTEHPMKPSTLALLAAMTALTFGTGLAQAQTSAPAAPVVLAEYDEDEDGEGGGLFGLFGGHQRGEHGGKHGRQEAQERGEDDDENAGCRQGATDANGLCQTGQNATPPANGLFNNGAAPKAQMN